MKELRLAAIDSIEADNAFLPAFMERLNERFAVVPAKPKNLHRKVHLPTSRLRYVSAQLSFHHDRRQIVLERRNVSEELAGKYVELYDYTDDTWSSDGRASLLPIASSPRTSVSHKLRWSTTSGLGHALSLVKEQQDAKREVKVLTNSEKDGYKKRPRQVYGPGYIETKRSRSAVEMTV